MRIISHRGYWKEKNEKNLPVAFHRSFSLNFGTETDIRDYLGELVISHDIADAESISLESLLGIYCQYNKELSLSINIKADGLQVKLNEQLKKFSVSNYFVFDMSIPDTIACIKEDLRFFSRQSEYELQPALYDHCAGIWLDAFQGNWYPMDIILQHVKNKKEVCIVSPELHNRDVLPLWDELRNKGIYRMDEVILCTDIPEEAINFFK